MIKTPQFKDKQILLISPCFFGYEMAIKKKLEELGAKVTFIDDRPSNGLVAKSLIRTNKKLLKFQIKKYYETISNQILGGYFDIIFLLNPEAMPIHFLRFCRERWPKAHYVMYMWDSIKNRKHTLKFVPFCDRVFTFDKHDSLLPNFNFKPLFYLDTYSKIRKSQPSFKYDICFMGTLHSDRYYITKEVKEWCEEKGLRTFFFFFMQSKVLYYFSKFIGGTIAAPISELSFTQLNSLQVTDTIAKSKVILDIQHPKQTGLTIRTIEALGAGRKLITTNSQIREYDLYNSSYIRCLDRAQPRANLDLEFFTSPSIQSSDSILQSYSIGAWLYDLFQQ